MMANAGHRLQRWRLSPDHRFSLIVTSLSGAFGVALIQSTSHLAAIVAADEISSRESAQLALALVSGVFIVIAVYVSAIVTANTFATIVAARARSIALMRLIGSSASALRRSITREGLAVGLLGSLLGGGTGLALATLGLGWGIGAGLLPELDYVPIDPLVSLPLVVVACSTWAASWVGSRKVLGVTPLQAVGSAVEATREETIRRPVRTVGAGLMFFGGLLVLAGGVVVGLQSPFGFVIAFFGGILSFSGVVNGAHVVMPPALRLVGRMLGRAPSARLASLNALRYPLRSTRATIGLVIGVTLVTTFAVAAQGYADMISAARLREPESYQHVDGILGLTLGVFSVLIGFSALIAALGMVNNLSLGVLQRRRELGLLRALGFTARQVRRMILVESAQLTVAAVALGVVLGVGYGWAGAQSLLGSVHGSPGLVWPSMPWPLLAALSIGAPALILVAAYLPAARATTESPVLALSSV
jgi:putative ABC transport system permease protein